MEPLLDHERDKIADASAQGEDFFDEAGAQKSVFDAGHHEDSFDGGVDLLVHEGHLEFILEVGNSSETSDDDTGIVFLGELDQQAAKGPDLDMGVVLEDLADDLDPLSRGKEGFLFGIFQNGDQNMGKELLSPENDIDMAVGDRVERTRIDCSFFHGRPAFFH